MFFKNTGNRIFWKCLSLRFNGVIYGDKVGNICDFNLVWSRTSKLVALIKYVMGKYKRKDYVEG